MNATQLSRYDLDLIGTGPETNHRQILARISFREADFRAHDVTHECVEAGVGQIASNKTEARDDVRDHGFFDARFAGYTLSVDVGHWQAIRKG